MSFLDTLKQRYKMLENKEIMENMYKELTMKDFGKDEFDYDRIKYSYHLPVLLEDYLIELTEKLEEIDDKQMGKMDEEIKIYLMTFIYYCTNVSEQVTHKSARLAGHFYLKLIQKPNIGSKMILPNLVAIISDLALTQANQDQTQECIDLVEDLKNIIVNAKNLELANLAALTNSLGLYIMRNSSISFTTYGVVEQYCFKTLKSIIVEETEEARILVALASLFLCMQSIYTSRTTQPKDTYIMKFRKFITHDLIPSINNTTKEMLCEAILGLWSSPYFNGYEECGLLMNTLDLREYKYILRKMSQLMQSRNHKDFWVNIMGMLSHLIQNSGPFPDNKVNVFLEELIKQTIVLCLDLDEEISQKAIEVLSVLLQTGAPVMMSIWVKMLNNQQTNLLNSNSMLVAFHSKIDNTWGKHIQNKDLTFIICNVLVFSTDVNLKQTERVLYDICWNAESEALLCCLPILHEALVKKFIVGQKPISLTILRILLKMALGNHPTSKEYLTHIYNSLNMISRISGEEFSNSIYVELMFDNDLEVDKFFNKCNSFNMINSQDVTRVVRSLDLSKTYYFKYLKSLLAFQETDQLEPILFFISNNLSRLIHIPVTSFLFNSLAIILKEHMNVSPEVMALLRHCYFQLSQDLMTQRMNVRLMQSTILLLGKIAKTTRRFSDHERFVEQLEIDYNRKLAETLDERDFDFEVLIFASEFSIITNKTIYYTNVDKMRTLLENREEAAELSRGKPDSYLGMMTLIVTSAILSKTNINFAVKCIKTCLANDNPVYKTMGNNLLMTFCKNLCQCNMNDFFDLIFTNILSSDSCTIKLTATIIEQLVHDNNLKMNFIQFFKFMHLLGIPESSSFMIQVIEPRFLPSNPNMISQYLIRFIVYASNYGIHPDYEVNSEVKKVAAMMKPYFDCTTEIYPFLFETLPTKDRLKVIIEICSTFERLIDGDLKVDKILCKIMKIFIDLIKTMVAPASGTDFSKSLKIVSKIKDYILKQDSDYSEPPYYLEHKEKIKLCTLCMFKLMYYHEQDVLKIRKDLFETVLLWTDFFLPDLVYEINVEGNRVLYTNYLKVAPYQAKFFKNTVGEAFEESE